MKLRRDLPSGAFSVQGKKMRLSHCRGRSCTFRRAESQAVAFAVTENKLLTGQGINGTLMARVDFVM